MVMFHVMLVYQRVVIIPSTWNVADPIDITSYTVLWGKKQEINQPSRFKKTPIKMVKLGNGLNMIVLPTLW